MDQEKAIENIKQYGVCQGKGEKRQQILFKEMGLPEDQRVEYVIISGCIYPEVYPQVFAALKSFLVHFKVDYTFLSKEYCCAWRPLLQPAVRAKDEEKITKLKEISGHFVQQNIEQAKRLGAKALVFICEGCEPFYSSLRETAGLELLYYPQMLARFLKEGKLNTAIDFYPGCRRFRRRLTSTPFDFASAKNTLDKISGLKVNYIDSKACCFIPEQMNEILSNIKTRTIVTTCSGCKQNLEKNLAGKGSYQFKMLPEFVWQALKEH